MDEVVEIDTGARQLKLASGTTIGYDYLVLGTGATHSYFGHEDGQNSRRDSKPSRTLPKFAAGCYAGL
jgi:NADH dehydrogenase FAD-containing subunit